MRLYQGGFSQGYTECNPRKTTKIQAKRMFRRAMVSYEGGAYAGSSFCVHSCRKRKRAFHKEGSLVRQKGLEPPPWQSGLEPESSASANSATAARHLYNIAPAAEKINTFLQNFSIFFESFMRRLLAQRGAHPTADNTPLPKGLS